MLTKRIIACLDVRDGQVVKGVQFQELRHAGDPGALARRYNVEGIDEVVILDITATLEKRQAMARTITAVAKEIFLPLTVGGGIRSEEDADAAVEAGADKVSLNTAALKNPSLITTQPVAVDVELGGTLTTGETVTDWRGVWGREPNVDVAVDVDADEFLRRFVERVGELAAARVT